MHLGFERYVDEVLDAAALHDGDEANVREELSSHLADLESQLDGMNLTEQEAFTMMEKNFGSPRELGESIARAKGRFRTYLKKEARKFPIAAGVALTLAFGIRWQALETLRMNNASMEPIIPAGGYAVVNKLAHRFGEIRPGDLIAYKDGGRPVIAVVQGPVVAQGALRVSKGGAEPVEIGRDSLVGRVWIVAR